MKDGSEEVDMGPTPLDDLLRLDEDQNFLWTSCSPDSCYFSDGRSRAASGDGEPYSPISCGRNVVAGSAVAHPVMSGAASAACQDVDQALVDLPSVHDYLDPDLQDLFQERDTLRAANMDNAYLEDWSLIRHVEPHCIAGPTAATQHPEQQSHWDASGMMYYNPHSGPVPPWSQEASSYSFVEDASGQEGNNAATTFADFNHGSLMQLEKTDHAMSAGSRLGRRPKNDEFRPCHVCGERAGRHSYYGGQVCPSCRAFFRRSVQSKYGDIYRCSKDRNCQIGPKTRKNCQYCRFKLCEMAGMRRSWVLADGEKKKSSTGASKGSQQQSSDKPKSSDLSQVDLSRIQSTIYRMAVVRNQTETLNPEVMREIRLLLEDRTHQISAESRRAMTNVLEQRARLYALNIPEFMSLSSPDQITLMEGNKGALIMLRVATFFHTEVNWRQQMDMILGPSDLTRLTESLSGLQLAHDRQLEYEQFFQSQVPRGEDDIAAIFRHPDHLKEPIAFEKVRKAHRNLLNKISQWVEDETMFCLMNLILLFNTDQINSKMENRQYCEVQQASYCNLLLQYLKSKQPRRLALAKFVEGLRLISYCRELHDLAASYKLCCSDN